MKYLDPRRNIDPSIKTAPEIRMYQQEANSPVLKDKECRYFIREESAIGEINQYNLREQDIVAL